MCRYDIAQNGRYRTISLTLRVILYIPASEVALEEMADKFYNRFNLGGNVDMWELYFLRSKASLQI